MNTDFNTECSLGSYITSWGHCPDTLRSDFAPDNWKPISDGGTFSSSIFDLNVKLISTNRNTETAVVDGAFQVDTVSKDLREQGTAFWGDMQRRSRVAAIGFSAAAVGLGYLSHMAAERGYDTGAKVLKVASGLSGVIAAVAGVNYFSAGHQQKLWSHDAATRLAIRRTSYGDESFKWIHRLDCKWTEENPTGLMTRAEVGNAWKKAVDTLAQQYKNADSLDEEFFEKYPRDKWLYYFNDRVFDKNPLADNMYRYAHDGETSSYCTPKMMNDMYNKVDRRRLEAQQAIASVEWKDHTDRLELGVEYRRCKRRVYAAGVDTGTETDPLKECNVAFNRSWDTQRDEYKRQLEAANNGLQKALSRENSDVAWLLDALK